MAAVQKKKDLFGIVLYYVLRHTELSSNRGKYSDPWGKKSLYMILRFILFYFTFNCSY